MASFNGGELLVKAFESEGPQKIFSIPGGQLVGVYEAIRRSETLELVVPRHEGASAFMAYGYALAREKPAVVISTAGAGVIYEIDGLLMPGAAGSP
jgi:acetolactate synthase-1/2/3 large subunit